MKKFMFVALSLIAAVVFTGCKSQESAYRQAYDKAKAQEAAAQNYETTTVAVEPAQEEVKVTPVTPAPQNDADVRTINANKTVVAGNALRNYSVVCGSFSLQANAEGLYNKLRAQGYDARLIRTDENIKGITPWYRVIAASFDDKAQAVQSRNELRGTYADAWLLSK